MEYLITAVFENDKKKGYLFGTHLQNSRQLASGRHAQELQRNKHIEVFEVFGTVHLLLGYE
jgi:hypothetical protein